jgi:hypothetical protein
MDDFIPKTVIIHYRGEDTVFVSSGDPDVVERLHRHPDAEHLSSFRVRQHKRGSRFLLPFRYLDEMTDPYRDRS